MSDRELSEAWHSEEDTCLLESLTDSEILGTIESYDDARIDTVFLAYLELRRAVNAYPRRWIQGID